MSRFVVAAFVGATIAATVSTSAIGIILERAQSISTRCCIHRGGGAGCQIVWCRARTSLILKRAIDACILKIAQSVEPGAMMD
jgi:hypothetical protein